MCPFIAILALLVCANAVPPDKPIAIKDSEAVKSVGKEVSELPPRSPWGRH